MQTTLQERIQQRMEAMKLTNAQLAAACKVKPPTSFNWGSGKTKNIKGAPLLLAAKALGVTPEWLATGLGSKFPVDVTHREIREDTVQYLPQPKPDKLVVELLELFGQLDATGKTELIGYVRGFVSGRRPHHIGKAPAVAG
jgi:transcriptional regulator with XRE-family HTH domain